MNENGYTNQIGVSNFFAFDPAGRGTTKTDTNAYLLYTYNAGGDLVKLRDPKGEETTWGYDASGRVTSKTNALGVEILRYQYDAEGRLTKRWSLAKGETQYTYDSAGNLTGIDYPGSLDITFEYDANHRLTNMIDASGTTRFSYTEFGALASEDGP